MGQKGSTAALQNEAAESEQTALGINGHKIDLCVRHAQDDVEVTHIKVMGNHTVSTLLEKLSKQTGIPEAWLSVIAEDGSSLDLGKTWGQVGVGNGATVRSSFRPPRVAVATARLVKDRLKEIGWRDSLIAQHTGLAMFQPYEYHLNDDWSMGDKLISLINAFGPALQTAVEDFATLPAATVGEKCLHKVACMTIVADIMQFEQQATEGFIDLQRVREKLQECVTLMVEDEPELAQEAAMFPLGTVWQDQANVTYAYLNRRLDSCGLPACGYTRQLMHFTL